ncbi:MAG: DUF616 domain-containing protein [Candidatus Peribacteraceae bacterium]|nr:DUF616 domain-containing protein [Candidatus Peribacteraceae bacterium]
MVIVYTCNIGHYDLFRNIFPKPNDRVKYVYFTDEDEAPVNGWKVIKVDRSVIDNPRKLARYYKINSHKVLPPHDISLWLDARYIIDTDAVYKFIVKFKKNDISCFSYPYDKRDCLYKEAIICATNGMSNLKLIYNQVARYRDEGFPKHYGLFATGIMIRQNTNKVAKFNEIWWNEIENYSHRDQISQCYASWKAEVPITPIQSDGNVYKNEIAFVYKHRVHRKEDNKRNKNGL